MKRKFGQYSAILGVFLLCILAAVSLTFAWLGTSRQAQAQNMQMQIDAGGMRISRFQAFRFDSELGETIASLTDGKYTMDDYDSIFTNRNDMKGLLFEVELADIPADCTSISITYSTQDSAAAYKTSQITYLAYRISGGAYTEDLTDISSVHHSFSPDGRASFSGGTATLQNIPVSSPSAVIFLLLDYDHTVIDSMHIDPFQQGSSFRFEDQRITFENDLGTIFFEAT